MGRDKARLRIGTLSLLGHVRRTAQTLGIPVRVIRRDLVPRCGPLGGVFTALKSTAAERVVFLACDMPFVSPTLLARIARKRGRKGVFVACDGVAGFPFVLPVGAIETVATLIQEGSFSMGGLAARLDAALVNVTGSRKDELINLNTPADLERVRHGQKNRRQRT
jgi:molybdenum cofactor guanylyltransferase